MAEHRSRCLLAQHHQPEETHVHTRQVGQRPFIELEPTSHALAIEQRTGITMDRVREIAEAVIHSAN
ncbi:DUF2199 domain-containing protein [Streptomyces sp. NPDC046716]|uniref:DUF2199 domain-containing protein n=1 Tax=Streptomyces sp. NPDC046716 TaxID=3157093 RepID=UPI0033F0B552